MKYFVLSVVLVIPMSIGCANVYTLPVFQQFAACPNNPALSVGPAGSFDGGSVRDNVLWYGRGRLWTLYTAAQFGVPPYNPTIGIAWSSDGCAWTKGGQIISPNLTVPECAGGVFSPGTYYDAQADILTISVSCVSDPAYWYTGPIRIAELQAKAGADWTKSDSYRWQNSGQPVLTNSQSWEGSQGVYAPSIIASGLNYYLYYSSSSSNGTYQAGIAVSGSPTGPWVKSNQNPITPANTNCEEPAPINLSSGKTYLLCDTVGIDRQGVNVFALMGTDPMRRADWAPRGIVDLPRAAWSAGEIGSQSLVELSDGRILMTYNGKPAGTQSDVRAIGFSFVTFKNP